MEQAVESVQVSVDLTLERTAAFDVVVDEIATVLADSGITLEGGANGRLTVSGHDVGRVVMWRPGERIVLEWHATEDEVGEATRVEFRFEPAGIGTRVSIEHLGWGRLVDDPGELAGWFAKEVAAPLLRAMTPEAFGDWVTDRRARHPSGAQAREIYRDPLYHYPNFRVIVKELSPTADDYLLEVGCGGGALLKQVLQSGCRAAAVDHSIDMVRLAREENRDAVQQGRLEVRHASAERLPFPDETFTCAVMTGVLGFLPDPVTALKEIRRVLAGGGRIVVLGSDPELRGTPAAPEPMASRLRFYYDEELRQLATDAGYTGVRVEPWDLEPFAREVGVPPEHVPLFSGSPARFLIARKD